MQLLFEENKFLKLSVSQTIGCELTLTTNTSLVDSLYYSHLESLDFNKKESSVIQWQETLNVALYKL